MCAVSSSALPGLEGSTVGKELAENLRSKSGSIDRLAVLLCVELAVDLELLVGLGIEAEAKLLGRLRTQGSAAVIHKIVFSLRSLVV